MVFYVDKDLKFKIITEGSTNGVTNTCRKYNISRTLYYRWLNRYKAKGIDGLDSVKRGFIPFNKTNKEIETALLNLIKKYPTYGPKAIKYLFEDLGYKLSESAIYNIMKRNNLSTKENRIKFSRKHPCKITSELPDFNLTSSGQCWLFWITNYGHHSNVGNLYEFTLFDYKSKIACSRLYNEATFNNFEDLLTALAMPVAKTLNLKVNHLCILQDEKTFNLSQKNFTSEINKLLEDNRFDFKIQTLSNKNNDFIRISEVRENFTKEASKFLIPLLNSSITFSKLKFQFQDYIRNYNILYKTTFDEEEYTPVEYHNKLTNTKLILPMWAYINREY